MHPYHQFVKARFKTFPTFAESFLHAAIGMAGEVIELQNANTREIIVEKLGDLEFYWVAMGIVLEEAGAKLGEEIPDDCFSLPQTLATLVDDSAFLLDQAKKFWVYNKSPELETLAIFHEKIGDLLSQLNVLLAAPVEEVRDENMAKLRRRYPDGYTDKTAQERADKEGRE